MKGFSARAQPAHTTTTIYAIDTRRTAEGRQKVQCFLTRALARTREAKICVSIDVAFPDRSVAGCREPFEAPPPTLIF